MRSLCKATWCAAAPWPAARARARSPATGDRDPLTRRRLRACPQLFVALANLDAPTYQVVYQCKTVFTALFSRLLLGRRLKESQWIALWLLCLGGVLVSDLSGGAKGARQQQPSNDAGGPGGGGSSSFVVGLCAVLAAAVLSASSSVYFEKMLKKQAASPQAAAAGLWLRNIQLGIFAAPLAALTMLLNDGEFVTSYGFLHGFDAVVWLIVVLNGLGGLLVAATMKYADNIVKCFAAALAILSGTLLSVPIFGFELSPIFAVGVACTITASILYSWAPERPARCARGAPPAYALVPARGEEGGEVDTKR